MKLLLTFLLLFSFSLLSYGQQQFHFGVEVMPKYTLINFHKKPILGDPQLGYSIGGNIYYAINERHQIYTGIHVNQINLDFINYSMLLNCDFNSSHGNDYLNSYMRHTQELYYVTIPLRNKFKLNEQDNHLYIQSGFDFLYLSSSKIESYITECGQHEQALSQAQISPISFILLPNVGVGYEFKVYKNIKSFIEFKGEVALTDLFHEFNTINIPYYNFGISTGIKF